MDNWIVEYIRQNYQVSATDQPFHEAFFAKFGGKRKETCSGARIVYKAQRRLKKLWEEGSLDRHIHNTCALFPRWIYVYRVCELERGWEIQI